MRETAAAKVGFQGPQAGSMAEGLVLGGGTDRKL